MWLKQDTMPRHPERKQIYLKLCRSQPKPEYPAYSEQVIAAAGYERWKGGALNDAVLADLVHYPDDGTRWWLEGCSI